jgi:DNA repair protein RecO (recombination protein O)
VIVKTHAVVLQVYPVSNTSRVVVWLTRDSGKVSTIIKGAMRPKSMFLGQFDLFYTCELLYYARPNRTLYIAKECCPLNMRPSFRKNWKGAAAASYFTDIIARISPSDAHHPGFFELLERNLDAIHDNPVTHSLVYWFELQLLGELGLAPRLSHCLHCNKSLAPSDRRSSFSYAHGGILCAPCSRNEPNRGEPIAPDILATLRAWQRARHARAVCATRSTVRQVDSMRQLLGLFLRYHLDNPLRSRDLALDMLNRTIPGSTPARVA